MKDKIIYESIKSLRQEGLKFSVDTFAENLKISKKTFTSISLTKERLRWLYMRNTITTPKKGRGNFKL